MLAEGREGDDGLARARDTVSALLARGAHLWLRDEYDLVNQTILRRGPSCCPLEALAAVLPDWRRSPLQFRALA